ncbi:MAG: D-alanine--D-alanine ligase family protein [Clostridia bacterium]
MSDLTLAVLFGGRACEHDVSIISGLQAADAAEKAGYRVVRTYIGRDGAWFVGDALKDIKGYAQFDPARVSRVLPLGEGGKLVLIKYPEAKKALFGAGRTVLDTCDVAFPVMHGMNGEDGTLQGMFEMMDVPYTSAGVLGSSVGMDKILMKQLFKGCGLNVLPGEWVSRDEWEKDRLACLDRMEEALPYPMYAKPANLGSSIGISRADDRAGLERAIDVAAAYDRRVLVEKGVSDLREVNCAVLGYAGHIRASVLEMPVRWDKFLTFDEKYLRSAKGGSKGMASLSRQIPAPISAEATQQVKDMALSAFRAMDLKGVVRVDFILDGDEIYLNEVNTIPGSLAFYLWEATGVSFGQLIDTLVEDALSACADKRKSVFSFDSNILAAQCAGSKGSKA